MSELQKQFNCHIAINPDNHTKKKIAEKSEVIIVRSPVVLDEEVLSQAKNLKLVIRAGVGVDNIDVEFLKRQKIRLETIPLSQSIAEHVLGLILALYRSIPNQNQALKNGQWNKNCLGREISGKTIGLIGLGRVGRNVAKLLNSFEVKMLAHDRSPQKPVKQKCAKEFHISFVNLKHLFSQSDIITIQIPLQPESYHIINQDLFRIIKQNAIIVNVARGKLIDEHALYQFMVNERISGAALDVFETEPPTQSPLLRLPNFIGTPHVAAQTHENQFKIGKTVLETIRCYYSQNYCT